MEWIVVLHEAFTPEFLSFPQVVQDAILTAGGALQAEGPTLGRPLVDTLKGSAFPNMKEIRLGAGGAWRVAFAFDPGRNAILLVAGNKAGANQTKFYKDLIRVADQRFASHVS